MYGKATDLDGVLEGTVRLCVQFDVRPEQREVEKPGGTTDAGLDGGFRACLVLHVDKGEAAVVNPALLGAARDGSVGDVNVVDGHAGQALEGRLELRPAPEVGQLGHLAASERRFLVSSTRRGREAREATDEDIRRVVRSLVEVCESPGRVVLDRPAQKHSQ